MSLQEIIDKGRYPIVFIGAGISKRYLENYPNWNQLLKSYWELLDEEKPFFAYLNELKHRYSESVTNDTELDFKVNAVAASEIEQRYNDSFFEEKISLEGLTSEEAYTKKISAFKVSLGQKFSKYTIKDDIDEEELQSFGKFLEKARMIVTTNYDTFLEDRLEERNISPMVYVGQNGFFEETIGWNEIYKIHGDAKKPCSIIINDSDYRGYDKNSILISAKVLSTMIHSPIIFLGYSLNDRNVLNLLSDYSSQLPKDDIGRNKNRITVVEYKKGMKELNEFVNHNPVENFDYSVIQTDNFKTIYDAIATIDEGLTPNEVLRYQKAIKEIVVSAEEKRSLDSVLVTPTQLANVEKEINAGKPIVVALGNKKNMFVLPDIITYMEDYLFEKNEILPKIALEFVARNGGPKSRIPFVRYWKNTNMDEVVERNEDKEKLLKKVNNEPNLHSLQDKISDTYKKNYSTIKEIENAELPVSSTLLFITYNVQNFKTEELKNFIEKKAFPQFVKNYREKNNSFTSHYRRLFLAYDFVMNGDFV